jgi:GNAT superfamily N-acetyltransferase
MTTSHQIVRADPSDALLIADLIAHAFWDLPPAAWLVPDALVRRRVLAGQFGIVVDHALEYGHIYLTADMAGVAVWFPRPTPIVAPPRTYVPRLEKACGRWTDHFLVLDDLFEQHHPPEPHHHLVFLAVRHDRQRQGVGSMLLDHYHHRLGTLSMAAYLEAPSAANVDFYKRHGYEAREPFYLPGDGPPFWPMWREPR